jgi:N-acetyl sugar amidotransferase
MLKSCTRCLLPETYETIEFDRHGVCNVCRNFDTKAEKIDWSARLTDLHGLAAEHKGQGLYDCILPFSGGKDSTYTLWYVVRELGLKPLVVQFNHGFMRGTLLDNNVRTFKKLGVDVMSFTPNWHVVKRLMLEALVRKGDFCWHCHTGIYSYPMHIALKFQVPLVVWGESSAEYTAYYNYGDDEDEEVGEEFFNRVVNLGITAEDMLGMIEGDFPIQQRDLWPYTYPPKRELKKLKYRSIHLGAFVPWDVKKNVDVISRELDWRGDQVEGMPWDQYPYEKIECYMQGMRDYIKYLKRGYGRVTQMVALDLRNGRISPERAKALISEHEGRKPPSLNLFLEYLGLNEEQFNNIVAQTVVPPNAPHFGANEWAPKTHDFEQWYREASQDRGIRARGDASKG